MATIVLQAAGAFLGSFLGPVGGVIGSAIGATAGYWIDQTLIRGTQTIEGQRLKGQRPFTAEEGAPLPRIYGSTRIAGTMIWATRFEERKKTSRQGGKGGGAKVTEYRYYANVAFALCEGEIACVRRIWADGREIDQSEIELRVYRGDEEQPADPLIGAKQGSGNAPAYRGTAYVVFERLSLTDHGNRIPQFHFEVIRPVGAVARQVRAVAMIPGSSEYALSTSLVTRTLRQGEHLAANRHVFVAGTDIEASLDELLALCPNLKHVALVVTWFGDDLRCGHCSIRPTVVDNRATGYSAPWLASGIERSQARQVSSVEAKAAFGGSPSDASVMQAIALLKARGVKVTLNPFMMMDIPADNALPDPYGGGVQAAYPWRGRISCFPAPVMPGTANRTAAARSQIAAFCGGAAVGDFTPRPSTIEFEGAADDWGYRRFVLHFAELAKAAGDVDAFLIGSELRGLTTLRDDAGGFPFVAALCGIAQDVRAVLGPATKITYGADWSEYFGHQAADGSSDVFYHLDALWAHPAIDAVGIDNYMPLSDWRDEDYQGGNPDGFALPYDPQGLRRSITAGEGFDWYYSSDTARGSRTRSSIADGAFGKPWVFRYKDLVSWWSNFHYDRPGGVESAAPTAWMPRGKPIWFTEIGCPAIDKGPNQPNVFTDQKSTENAVPYFSNGGRSDMAQLRFLEAHFAHWDPASPNFDSTANPVSSVYGGRMVDHERLYVWAWDARPFPAFPLRADEWSDAKNWHVGHWLNGRITTGGVGEVINAILTDHGLPTADVSSVDGSLAGFLVDEPTTARSALEPIVDLYGLHVAEHAGSLRFFSTNARGAAPTAITEKVWDGGTAALEITRQSVDDLPTEAMLGFRDAFRDYQTVSATSRRTNAGRGCKATTAFPGTLEPEQAQALLDDWLRRLWFERETISLGVANPGDETSVGAAITLSERPDVSDYLITETEDGVFRQIRARKVLRAAPSVRTLQPPVSVAPDQPYFAARPLALLMDLPLAPGQSAPQDQLRLAAWQRPWKSQSVLVSPEMTGFEARTGVDLPATVGVLAAPLLPSFEGRFDQSTAIEVDLFDGELASVSRLQVLNGANAGAILSTSGVWEIIQFERAEEIAPDRWRLTGLLRGQLGTNDAMAAGAVSGAYFVLLDEAVRPAGLRASEIGLTLNWRVGPAGATFSDENFTKVAAMGGLRARLPLSPAHLTGITDAPGTLQIDWIRRGRIDVDDWDLDEIPLGEAQERYLVEIFAVDGTLKRSQTVTVSSWLYTASDIVSDFGSRPAAIDVTVRQVGSAGPGIPTRRRFALS